MALPTSYEVAFLVDSVCRYTSTERNEMAALCGLSKANLTRMLRSPNPPPRSFLIVLRRACRVAMSRGLGPTRPPMPGVEKEWVEHCRGIRIYLDKIINQTLSSSRWLGEEEHRRVKWDQSLK